MKSLDVLGISLVIVGVLGGGLALCAGLGANATPPTTLGVVSGLVSLAAFTGGWLRFREPSTESVPAPSSPETTAPRAESEAAAE